MGRGEEKIATGRFRVNMAARHSFSREVNNAINEGKLVCSHPAVVLEIMLFRKRTVFCITIQ